MKLNFLNNIRPDFLTTAGMFGFILLMAFEPNLQKRLFFLVPIIMLYIATNAMVVLQIAKKSK